MGMRTNVRLELDIDPRPHGFELRWTLADEPQVTQVKRARGPPLGRVEMALPLVEVVVSLDSPPGAVFAIGRRDVRCLVGFAWTREVFPLTFRSLPARYVDENDVVIMSSNRAWKFKTASGDLSPQRKLKLAESGKYPQAIEPLEMLTRG